jgi:hypothetical protein
MAGVAAAVVLLAPLTAAPVQVIALLLVALVAMTAIVPSRGRGRLTPIPPRVRSGAARLDGWVTTGGAGG